MKRYVTLLLICLPFLASSRPMDSALGFTLVDENLHEAFLISDYPLFKMIQTSFLCEHSC